MHVALIRGINVGTAKRVAMADLRALMEKLGYRDVRTLLGSGSVVFDAGREAASKVAARIEGVDGREAQAVRTGDRADGRRLRGRRRGEPVGRGGGQRVRLERYDVPMVAGR